MGSLANSIRSVDHLAAIDQVFEERLSALDLSVIMVYIIDNVPSEALYYLADQFNVLAWKGWNLAATDKQKRDLIKKAILLNRHKGTVWAIKEAVKSVGFKDVEVREGVGLQLDGTWDLDGSNFLAGGNWATFRVKIILPDDGTEVTSSQISNIRQMVLAYKNARSHLSDVSFGISFSDTLGLTDTFDDGAADEDFLADGFYLDGVYNLDGTKNLNKGEDSAEITIFNQFGEIIANEQF